MKINPYITLGRKSVEALDFYKTLGFKQELLHLIDEDGKQYTGMDIGEVLHATLSLDGEVFMMSGSSDDTREGTISISETYNEASKQRFEKMFETIEKNGGKVVMPMGPTFWAKQFGMVTDVYGITWMFNLEEK